MNQINKRTQDVEQQLAVREQELAKTKQQFAQLTQDFRYNLKLLEDRDAELERLDAAIVTHRANAEKADNALQQQKSLVTEREAEVRREKSRIAELEGELGGDGRILIRPSGTEPLVRVMVEAALQADAERIATTLADAIERSYEPMNDGDGDE